MALWNTNNAPEIPSEGLGSPYSVVATSRGWENAQTGELLVAIRGLESLQSNVNIEEVFITAESKQLYKQGDIFSLTVVLTQKVTVTGSPQITVGINGTNVVANYVSGSGTNSLVFQYAVPNNISSVGGSVSIVSPITLNGGTIVDTENSSLNAQTAFTPPPTSKVIIDGVAPTITGATLDKASYKFGDTLTVTLTASEAVTVVGNPTLALVINGTTRQSQFASGSGTNTLKFTYTVQNGDAAAAGQFSMANAVVLPTGASISDTVGNAAVLSFTPPVTTSVVVSGTIPAVTAAALDKSLYKIGDVMALTLTMNEATNVVGIPTVGLTVGNTARQAAYASGSGSTSLVFHYTVVNGDYASAGELGISDLITLPSGASLEDAAGNAADLTFTPPNTSAVVVNGETPTVTNAALDKAAYVTGNDINLTLTMNEATTVTGSPTIALTIGAATNQATYAGGSGTTALLFTYLVASGDKATAGQFSVAGTIVLAGGTMADSAGNPANLSFTPPVTSSVTVN